MEDFMDKLLRTSSKSDIYIKLILNAKIDLNGLLVSEVQSFS